MCSSGKKAPYQAAPDTYRPGFAIEHILSAADIVSGQNIEFVEQASGPARSVYQWKTHDVFGSAEQKPLSSAGEFEEHVREYLERTEERCTGDFAIVPDETLQNGESRVDTYEVACVGPSVSASASLLFF